MTLACSSPLRNAGARFGILAAISAALLSAVPAPASARDGGAIAAGVIGGMALGALAAGAATRPAPPPPMRVYEEREPVYYREAPPPPPPRRIYVEPACGWEMQRVWTGYRWVHERVQVCD